MSNCFLIGQEVIDKKNFKVFPIHRENWLDLDPYGSCFSMDQYNFEQSWKRITKRPFVPNYFQIDPVVFDKKLLMFTQCLHRNNKPSTLVAIFFD